MNSWEMHGLSMDCHGLAMDGPWTILGGPGLFFFCAIVLDRRLTSLSISVMSHSSSIFLWIGGNFILSLNNKECPLVLLNSFWRDAGLTGQDLGPPGNNLGAILASDPANQ